VHRADKTISSKPYLSTVYLRQGHRGPDEFTDKTAVHTKWKSTPHKTSNRRTVLKVAENADRVHANTERTQDTEVQRHRLIYQSTVQSAIQSSA